MLPVARSALRRIGDGTDVVTYVSRYTRNRFASAFGPGAALEHLPPGVDTDRFVPDPAARAEMRSRYGLGERPVIVCLSRLVPRKGQDMLIRALPAIRERVDGATLVIVGGGPYLATLHRLARRGRRHRARGLHRRGARRRTARPPRDGRRVRDAVPHPRRRTGRRGPRHRLPGSVGDGRAGGRRPVGRRAGNRAGRRDGTRRRTARMWTKSPRPSAEILADPDRAAQMGAAGRRWAVDNWQWRTQAARLAKLLAG